MKIFISYKRDGGIDIAARVANFFKEKRNEVFYDIESMQLGRFDKQIEKYIAHCDCFVVLLTKGALDSEWVQREIKCALKNKKAKIVPLMMPGFEAPANLDPKIASILSMHGVEYNAVLFEQVMEKLNNLIAPQLGHYEEKLDQVIEALNNVVTINSQFMLALRMGDNDEITNNLKEMGQEIMKAHNLAEEIQDVNNKVVEQTGKVRLAMKNVLDKLQVLSQQIATANSFQKIKLKNDFGKACGDFLQVTTTALQVINKIKHNL